VANDPGQLTGLQNQGATCYMNSLLQQLYHIPSFTEGILCLRAPHLSLLEQLQVTLGSLRVSTKHYFDSLPLCRTLSLNLVEQKDVNEFATQLFDRYVGFSLQKKHAPNSKSANLATPVYRPTLQRVIVITV